MPLLNYLILAHSKPYQLRRLVSALQHPEAAFFVHIDLGTDQQPFEQALSAIPHVYFIQNRYACSWGDISLVLATLQGMKAVVNSGRAGVTILLSGQDYPLWSNDRIQAFFAKNPDTNFIDTTDIATNDVGFHHDFYKRLILYRFSFSRQKEDILLLPPIRSKLFWKGERLWFNLTKICSSRKNIQFVLYPKNWVRLKRLWRNRIPPVEMTWVGGPQWWVLTASTQKKVLAFFDQYPETLAFHRFTHVPDEIAIHSVVAHVAKTDPEIRVAKPLTYTNWSKKNVPHPVTFELEDWQELKSASEVFMLARKFDQAKDAAILDTIDAFRSKGF